MRYIHTVIMHYIHTQYSVLISYTDETQNVIGYIILYYIYRVFVILQ